MLTRPVSLILLLPLTIFLDISASAQQPVTAVQFGYSAGRLEATKLLTAEVGWAATRNHLFWTTDDGQHWKDITPKPPLREEVISAVFFLDTSTG
jgi:hypothetical protein